MRTLFFVSMFCFHSLATAQSQTSFSFPQDFLWGVATAPAHVEDEADDTWIDFAETGGVAAVPKEIHPYQRLQFWTKPEVEIDLAAETGAGIYRVGVDWQRLVPRRPGSMECGGVCPATIQNKDALAQYKKILSLIRSRNMKVMVTLFHHSSPKWFKETGGWQNPETIEHFRVFGLEVMRELGPQVDYWITFNEPTIFGLLTYVTGLWPYGEKGGALAFVNLGFYQGKYAKAMSYMAEAHRQIYRQAPSPQMQIGVAHHFSYLVNSQNKTNIITRIADYFWTWSFLDKIKNEMSFIGMNYYGAEFVQGFSATVREDQEYSEAGRAIAPEGLYHLLKRTYDRYATPIFITENGVADATDILRPSYILEHLTALHSSLSEKVPVLGYIFWTVSDNWEWADGYCPKFGLVDVDRRQNLKRTPRGSYYLFQKIIRENSFQQSDREKAWLLVTSRHGQPRPFCRTEDGLGSHSEPVERPIKNKDWRFRL